jgi:hypothetical protein
MNSGIGQNPSSFLGRINMNIKCPPNTIGDFS